MSEQAAIFFWGGMGWKGSWRIFARKNILPRQANELTAGNLGARWKTPNEVQGVKFWKNLEFIFPKSLA